MLRKLAAALLVLTPILVSADGTPTPVNPEPTVSISARGHDVRQVLTDMFVQAKKSCVIQKNVQSSLYLSLTDTPFQKALEIVCQQADVTFDIKDGVYFIHRPVKSAAPLTIARPMPAPAPVPHKLSTDVLARRLTTRLKKAPIAQVLEAFTHQTGVTVELDPKVPAYRLDAFLINTSLKYALDEVTKAAGLVYTFTDHATIQVAPEPSRVTIAP